MEEKQRKLTNKDLYEKQLEMLKLFYERNLLSKLGYDSIKWKNTEGFPSI